MIIDAHAHACGAFLQGKSIIKILDANNVDKVVLVPGELGSDKNYPLPDIAAKFPDRDVISFTNVLTKMIIGVSGAAKHIDEGNTHIFSLTNEYPDRILQFYWVRLSQANILAHLENRFSEYHFKGIKLHQCWESFQVSSENFHNVADWASSKDLPIFVHLFSHHQATQLANYITAHPNTTFIIAHLFGLECYIQADMSSTNVFFEISPPPLVAIPRLQKALTHFGAQRIVLGSDIPYGRNNLAVNIERVRNLQISHEEKKLILGDNMRKILKI